MGSILSLEWVNTILHKRPQSGADPESYFEIHVVPLDNQRERVKGGTWNSVIRFTPGGWFSLALDSCPPRRGCSNNKPTGRRSSSVLVDNSLGKGNI